MALVVEPVEGASHGSDGVHRIRAENEDGADVSCLHCGACVPVCPTNANSEYDVSGDLRRISTDWSRCVGCGTCVEICPANQANGGRTLRVMEAPTREFFKIAQDVDATVVAARSAAELPAAAPAAAEPVEETA